MVALGGFAAEGECWQAVGRSLMCCNGRRKDALPFRRCQSTSDANVWSPKLGTRVHRHPRRSTTGGGFKGLRSVREVVRASVEIAMAVSSSATCRFCFSDARRCRVGRA